MYDDFKVTNPLVSMVYIKICQLCIRVKEEQLFIHVGRYETCRPPGLVGLRGWHLAVPTIQCNSISKVAKL